MLKIVLIILLVLIGLFFLSGMRKKSPTKRITHRRRGSTSHSSNDSYDSGSDCGGDGGGCDGGGD